MLDAFRAAGVDNFQAFPAVLAGRGAEEWKDYFAINVLGKVAAADLSSSRFVEIGKYPSGLPCLGFQKLVVDPSRTHGFYLFRLAEDILQILLHDRVLKSLVAMAPTGGWGIHARALDEKR
jgi:hypothetical protein